MCWVAVERAIRMAVHRGLPADHERWSRVRDEIHSAIMRAGWSKERQAFVQYEGSSVLDASVLMMPLAKFISPTDPKWLSTLDELNATLVSDTLVSLRSGGQSRRAPRERRNVHRLFVLVRRGLGSRRPAR